jgi:phage protein D
MALATSTVLAAIGLGISAAGTGYSIHSGEKQREAIETEKGKAAAREQDQVNAAEKLKADALAKEQTIMTRDAQAARARVAGMGRRGRAGTILTSPSGTAAPAAPAVGKTILGA